MLYWHPFIVSKGFAGPVCSAQNSYMQLDINGKPYDPYVQMFHTQIFQILDGYKFMSRCLWMLSPILTLTLTVTHEQQDVNLYPKSWTCMHTEKVRPHFQILNSVLQIFMKFCERSNLAIIFIRNTIRETCFAIKCGSSAPSYELLHIPVCQTWQVWYLQFSGNDDEDQGLGIISFAERINVLFSQNKTIMHM